MNDENIQQTIDNTVGSTTNTERRHSKPKPSSKAPKNETETPLKSSEKKKRAPVITITPGTDEPPKTKTRNHKVHESEDNTPATAADDQEVPVKPKKKRAAKGETNNENTEIVTTEEPAKKKKSKAPKPPPPPIDDEFQVIEIPAIDELEPRIETKPKDRKKLKSKAPKIAISDSFEDLQVTNLDEMYPNDADIGVDKINGRGDTSFEDPPPPYLAENETSEYEKAIMDAFNNLASRADFSQYVSDDQWRIIYLPKSARTEPKSRIRKMLPGGEKGDKKPANPKGTVLKRIRTGVQTLIGDEKNLIFGTQSNYDPAYYEDDPDEVDTDDLHRYAQRLRELEDTDREVNPEYLVLRDGKSVYGVHEADTDGKVTLATRKPIYDRHADQKPDEQSEKKTLLSRLKLPFGRNKDKNEKNSKSASGTPDPQIRRKSSRKSLNGDMTTLPTNDPLID